MEKVTKSLLVLAIILMANIHTSEGGRNIPKKEDELMYSSSKLFLPPPPLWWLKIWWLAHGWLKPFPPFAGIGPLAEVAKLKDIVDHLGTKYGLGIAGIPVVDAETEDGSLN